MKGLQTKGALHIYGRVVRTVLRGAPVSGRMIHEVYVFT